MTSIAQDSAIALSTTQAEYVAATVSACQAVWLRRILSDLGEEQEAPKEIYCDSMSAVMLARNLVLNNRMKHIEIKHHYIRELLEKGEVTLESCTTEEKLQIS